MLAFSGLLLLLSKLCTAIVSPRTVVPFTSLRIHDWIISCIFLLLPPFLYRRTARRRASELANIAACLSVSQSSSVSGLAGCMKWRLSQKLITVGWQCKNLWLLRIIKLSTLGLFYLAWLFTFPSLQIIAMAALFEVWCSEWQAGFLLKGPIGNKKLKFLCWSDLRSSWN